MPTPIIFLGPSLSHAEARRFIDADFRPPVRRGDLDDTPAGAFVAIIDGVFGQSLAVSPREVQDALDRGVRIFGGSSMGALRAAEVPGVVGVGRVYEMFRDAEIEDDDEVAIVFDGDTLRSLSEPMVNVRHAVDRLARPGTISRDTARAILRAAKSLPYRDRVYRRILEVAGLTQRTDVAQLATMLASHDLKREDAVTLLERLRREIDATQSAGFEPAAVRSASTHEGDPRPPDAAARHLRADAPVYMWEFGPPFPFSDIVRFLAFTGKLPRLARNAVARFALQGNELVVDLAGGPGEDEVSARVNERVAATWVWTTEEEASVSLGHVGIGTEPLGERIAEEVAAERRVMAVTRERSLEFLEALRVELFMNELELKRATVRALSLRALAERDQGASARWLAAETRDATLKLCELVDAKDRAEAIRVLGWWGVSEAEVSTFIDELARARHAAKELHAARREASSAPVRGVDRRFRKRLKPSGERRFCTAAGVALSHCNRLRGVVGITRVAVITGLADFGIPNAQATRPNGSWSSTVGSGKSETVAGAKIGAMMEEIEKWAQEQFPREGRAPAEVTASYDELRRGRHIVLDPRTLDLPFDTSFHPGAKIAWRACDDLIGGKQVLVPSAALVRDRVSGDILYSPHGGRKVLTTNGLASGFTLEEAITHGLCECIERHGNTLAAILDGNPGAEHGRPRCAIALETVPASTRKLLRRILKASYSVRLLDISADVRVPTFAALIWSSLPSDERLFGSAQEISRGTASHPDPEVALNMAILEAVQTVMANVAAAREDLTLQSRSLGRHERSGAITRAALAMQRSVDAPTRAFDAVLGFVSRDAREDVRWVVERVRDAGYPHVLWADYTLPELLPARVVRVIVPGFETVNPFHSGWRARTALLSDLLPYDLAGARPRA